MVAMTAARMDMHWVVGWAELMAVPTDANLAAQMAECLAGSLVGRSAALMVAPMVVLMVVWKDVHLAEPTVWQTAERWASTWVV